VIQKWDRYYSFAFVRNPWDVQVSMFFYIQQMGTAHDEWNQIRNFSTFNQYIDRYVRPRWEVEPPRAQIDYLCETDGTILMSFVGRFESLQTDFRKICGQLSLGSISLREFNRSVHEEYRSYYSRSTQRLVSKWFERDIDAFGYCF
jgi:hypothetical protein